MAANRSAADPPHGSAGWQLAGNSKIMRPRCAERRFQLSVPLRLSSSVEVGMVLVSESVYESWPALLFACLRRRTQLIEQD
jgi:hypothetical protein